MKKSVVLLLILGLVASFAIAPAQAKKKKKKKNARVERVVEFEYSMPGIGVVTPGPSGGFCPFADPTALECIEFPLQAGETHVKVEVADVTGGKVAGFVSQGDTDGDGIGNLYGNFCTAHEEPIEMLSGSTPLRVSFYAGARADCAPSTPTRGTITVTFSNMP